MKNKTYNAVITGYGYDGEGVCKVEGKVTFLPFVIKGEEVELTLQKDTSSFCRGSVKAITSPSPLRENPPCPYFGCCGGCAYMHTTYQNELEIKKQLLRSHLKKVGFEGTVHVVESPQRYGYRNKIKLFVDNDKIGLKIRRSDKVVDIEKCLLVSDKINEVIIFVRSFVKGQNLYQFLQEIIIREENGKVLINFVKSSNKKIDYQGLYLLVGKNLGIFETFNGQTLHKLGLECLETEEFGLKCKFKPTSFHQVNRFVMPKMYQKVLELVKGKKVVNCYSGAGVLSGILLTKCERVIGIELGLSEHNDAQDLKIENNLKGLFNMHGDCGEVLSRIDSKDADMIVLDPPKAGIDKKVAERLNGFSCNKMVYVSCDSATMVRDIARMDNFEIKEVYLFDMFACTGEYEALALLEKKS